MTSWEYKQLEYLLAKLHEEVGHPFCIIPHYLHDGYHIGLYDSKGENITAASGPTIRDTVEKLKQQSTTNGTTANHD